jgi:hypothetical protein
MQALWFRVSARRQLAKDETGWTSQDSVSVPASMAIELILSQLPDEAVKVCHDHDTDIAMITIDWKLVPAEIRDPMIPARR